MMNVKINLDKLTLGDLETLEALGSGQASYRQMLDMFERFVEADVPVRQLPISALKEINAAMSEAIRDMANPKN